MIWIVFLLILAAIALLVLGCRTLKKKRLIEDIPTSRVAGLFLGLSEVKGRAEMRRPRVSFLAEIDCVHYAYTIQEKWQRTVTETYTDSKGKTRTRTRTETGWTCVAEGGESPPFMVRDETGSVRVVPSGAKIQALQVFSETCGAHDPLYYGKGPSGAVVNSVHQRSFTELAIPVGQDLYILGTARLRKDGVTPMIGHDPDDGNFLISVKQEERIVRTQGILTLVQLSFGLVFAVVGISLLAAGGFRESFGQWLEDAWHFPALAAAGYLFLVGIWVLILIYNGLVYLRNRVRNAWSQIDIQLRRRFALIPRLVTLVQAFADHEAGLFEEIARHRTPGLVRKSGCDAAGANHEAETQNRFLGRLLALVEDHPDLGSSRQFLYLQKRLSLTEDRIALARAFYNESVTLYNTRIATIPDLLVARLARFRPESNLRFRDLDRKSPRV